MTRVLVTGASGFVGSHLCEALVRRGHTVLGTHLTSQPPPVIAGVTWRPWLLADVAQLDAILQEDQPEHVYHLAGPAHVPSAGADPKGTIEQILIAAADFIGAVKRSKSITRVLYTSSGEVYAPPTAPDALLDEASEVTPRNVYGICKTAASQLFLLQAPDTSIVARPFNQIGPRQSPLFAVASFAQQIAAIAKGNAPPVLRTGNLDVERDFLDVRDSAEGHIEALEKGTPGQVYNICSGTGTKLADLVRAMIAHNGKDVRLELDPSRLRANDVPRIVGNPAKLRQVSAWKPRSNATAAAIAALDAAML